MIEIAVVTAIMGILAMVTMPSFVKIIETKREEAETASLINIEDDLKRGFQDTDPGRNISAFVGPLPPTTITQFATDFRSCPVLSDPTYPTAAAAGDWFVKLGLLRGIALDPLHPEVSEDAQKSLFDLVYNSYFQPRMLIAAPPETGQQRFMLISLMAPDSKELFILPNDHTKAWFDAIWNNNWENKGGGLPAYWTTDPSNPHPLAADQQAAWVPGNGSTTNCHRLIVKRIVQPKYTITVNNNASNYGWVSLGLLSNYICERGPGSGGGTIMNASGTAPLEVPAGTLVIFSYGATSGGGHPPPSPAPREAFRVNISENTAFNLQ